LKRIERIIDESLSVSCTSFLREHRAFFEFFVVNPKSTIEYHFQYSADYI